MISESDYKIYYIMFAVTIETVFPVDDDDDDDDDIGDISTCDMQATDDEVAEIFRKHIS